MQTKIHIIRHGITEGNRKGMMYGWSDIPLLPEGREALRKLSEQGVYPRPADAVYYTSDLRRTEETLEIIYGQVPHVKSEQLREFHFGMFELMPVEQIKAHPEYARWANGGQEDPPEGVEKWSVFKNRVDAGFDRIVNDLEWMDREDEAGAPEAIAVIHGGPIDRIMERFFGPRGNNFDWIPEPGRGYSLSLEDGKITGYTDI